MNSKNKSLILVHIAIFLFGSSSLFGKLINQPAFAIVTGRVLLSVTIMYIIFKVKKISINLKERSNYLKVLLLGVILSVHWVLFYHSVQVSTVAISLLTFSTCPIFATFIEPLFFRTEKLKKQNILVAFWAFLGVVIVVPKIDMGGTMFQGFVEGILAGFTFALVSVLERKYVKELEGIVISFYEQLIVFIILLPICIFTGINKVSTSDILYLIIFSVVFTLLSRYCYINGLKGVSAQTASVLTSLEPIYGIVLAAFILNETPTIKEVIGGIVIISAVIYSSVVYSKTKNN